MTADSGSGGATLAMREVTHGGDTAQLAGAWIAGISGSEGSYTFAAIDGTAANGLDVDVTRLPALVTGTAEIGKVKNSGTFVVQEDGAALTALQLLDNAVSGAGYNITQMAGVNLNMNTGVRATGTQRVTIATNDLVPITIASAQVKSGAFASGALASGSVASGAFATGALSSGSVASGAFASGSIVAGAVAAGATSFVKLEDVANAGADAGVPAMAVRKATPIDLSGTDGDYEFLQMDNGRLWTSGQLLSGAVESGAIASGAVASGAVASGALASGSIAAGAIVDLPSLVAGTALIGDVGVGVRTSGGATIYKNIDVDAKDEVKSSAGQVYWIHAMNTTAAPVFLKFYDLAAASVTVGTTVPDLTFLVPANADSDGAGFTMAIPNGIAFGTGITIAGTGLVADNDNTALSANALIVNLGFA